MEKKIKRIQDITFVEEYKDNIFSHISFDRILSKESLNPVIPNKTMLPKTSVNSTNLNYYILLLPIYQLLPIISSMSFILSKPPDKIQLEKIKQPC